MLCLTTQVPVLSAARQVAQMEDGIWLCIREREKLMVHACALTVVVRIPLPTVF